MSAAEEMGATTGLARACHALGVARASVYRRRTYTCAKRRPPPARALSQQERQNMLAVLNSERFMEMAPASVYATLLDEGEYIGSTRTMYRVLAANKQVRERRDQLRHPRYAAPELLATEPNQVWSWDITKLLGPEKWTYYYLYVMMDIFSRYVVGWLLADCESQDLAQTLIAEACAMQRIAPGQLTIHADGGAPMIAKRVAHLLADMGVTKTHSRPYVSNDNPFSEAQFKTMKYRPDFPERFGSPQHARVISRAYFEWYNTEHRHSGIAYMTPEDAHYGRGAKIRARRQLALDAAYRANPQRFVRRPPAAATLPTAVWINPPSPRPDAEPLSVMRQPVCPSPIVDQRGVNYSAATEGGFTTEAATLN
jgi:putative transposase